MARYIDEALVNAKLEEICENTATLYGIVYGGRAEKFARLTENIPTADVEEVVHAKWETVEREGFWTDQLAESLLTGRPTKRAMPICSHCKTEFGTIALGYKRCPECGAVMDKERENG